jgi:hypothetical protein
MIRVMSLLWDRTNACSTFRAVVRPLGSDALVRLLGHPLAAQQALGALLDVLAERAKGPFASSRDVLAWAESNGVSFPEGRSSARGRPERRWGRWSLQAQGEARWRELLALDRYYIPEVRVVDDP